MLQDLTKGKSLYKLVQFTYYMCFNAFMTHLVKVECCCRCYAISEQSNCGAAANESFRKTSFGLVVTTKMRQDIYETLIHPLDRMCITDLGSSHATTGKPLSNSPAQSCKTLYACTDFHSRTPGPELLQTCFVSTCRVGTHWSGIK